MSFVFHPEAEKEFREAIDYYEDIAPFLGYDFAVEVYSTIQLAVSFPYAWPVIENQIRRILIKRFPYGILYSKQNGQLFILAIMHLHRNPDYWKHRL